MAQIINPLTGEFDDRGFTQTQIEAIVDSRASEISSGVVSVNTKTGAVTLTASDVGAATTAQGTKADSALQPSAIGVTVASYTDARLSDARTPVSHNQAWSTITATPTTIVGYGITDAATSSDLSTHTANTSNPHSVTKTQVGLGSVANALQLTAANNLSDLTNVSTAISNLGLGSAAFSSALAFAPASHSQNWATITGTPTTLAGYGITDGGSAAWSAITGKPTTLAGYGIADAATSTQGAKADSALQASDIGVTIASYTDSRLSDARTPTAHNQAWSTITSRPTTLVGYGITDAATSTQGSKADTALQSSDIGVTIVSYTDARLSDARTPLAHNQAWSTITGTPTTLSGYGITNAVSSTSVGTMAAQNASSVAITGGTIDGVTIGATTPGTIQASQFSVTNSAGVSRDMRWYTGASPRWNLYADTTLESGSDAGSLLKCSYYSDLGAYKGDVFSFSRANGAATFSNGVTFNGALTTKGIASTGTQISITPGSSPSGGTVRSVYTSAAHISFVSVGPSSNFQINHGASGNANTGFFNSGGSIALQWDAVSSTNYGNVLIGTGTNDGVNKLQCAGSATFTGALKTTSTTASTSSTTGSLIAGGGVGVAGDLYAGGSLIGLSTGIKSGSNSLVRKPSGLTIATQTHYYGQTAPSSPALNDIWEEHDSTGKILMKWQWDATYWKSAEIYTTSVFQNGIGATSSGWYSAANYPLSTWQGLWVESCDYALFLQTTAIDASNYWTLQSLKGATNSSYTALHSAYQIPALAGNSIYNISVAATSQLMLFSQFFQFRYSFTKVGTPGNLLISGTIVYRIVR